MSHREGRDSDTRRHRSRFDREPSPKRSRRDGKPETERVVSKADVRDRADQDETQLRRLQDALPLEAPSVPDSSNIESGTANKESDRKNNRHRVGTNSKHSSPIEVPRSRSYFQQDEGGNTAQAVRSFGRRASTEHGWWRDEKDQCKERETKMYETRRKDEKPQTEGDDNDDWHHDRFFEMEVDLLPMPPPPNKKRPTFSEKKIPAATQSTDNTTKEPQKTSQSDYHVLGSERRGDRDRNPRHLDRQDRLTAGDQVPNRKEVPRGGFSLHERHVGGGGNFRGRDRFSAKQGFFSGGTRVEKWKHDLFEEANKSPPRKNEEDQIAKLESLLGS